MKADLLWREKYEMKKCELEERTRKRESEDGKRERGEDGMSNNRRALENGLKIFRCNSNNKINC